MRLELFVIMFFSFFALNEIYAQQTNLPLGYSFNRVFDKEISSNIDHTSFKPETQEFVVPKSIPIILLIFFYLNFNNYFQILSIAISIPKRNSIKQTDKKGSYD